MRNTNWLSILCSYFGSDYIFCPLLSNGINTVSANAPIKKEYLTSRSNRNFSCYIVLSQISSFSCFPSALSFLKTGAPGWVLSRKDLGVKNVPQGIFCKFFLKDMLLDKRQKSCNLDAIRAACYDGEKAWNIRLFRHFTTIYRRFSTIIEVFSCRQILSSALKRATF